MIRVLPVLLLPLLASPAAGEPGRFHVLDRRLEQRLDTSSRRAVQAVGRFVPRRGAGKLWGTGFVVHTNPRRGTALVMTALHVVSREGWLHRIARRFSRRLASSAGHGDYFELVNNGAPARAKIRRVVASSVALDYAIVEVQLPGSLAGVPALRLAKRRLSASEQVYNVAFPMLHRLSRAESKFSPTYWKVIQHAGQRRAPLKTIQSGHEVNDGRVSKTFNLDRRVPAQWLDFAVAAGSSGSPVLSKSGHEVVGLTRESGPEYLLHRQARVPGRRSMLRSISRVLLNREALYPRAVPMDLIKKDLAAKLHKGKVDPSSRAALAELLGQSIR